jgi:BMFP domain-containing protein YqiC
MIERLDRAVNALTVNLSEVRTELAQRLDTLEKRNDHLSTAVFLIESQMAGVGRSLDNLLTESGAQTGTLLRYQKAFNALEARVKALEEKLGGQGPRPQ